jgi:CheY-like chemotaxis protein
MATIVITSGLFTHADQTIEKLAQGLKLSVINDEMIIKETAEKNNLKVATLNKVIEGKQIAFNDFTHEKEKCISALRQTIALHIENGNCIFEGILGHLVPSWVTHVMRVLIISDKKSRIDRAVAVFGLNEKDAQAKVSLADKRAILWTNTLFEKKAWDDSLYDIVIPADKMDEKESADLISKHLSKLPGMAEGTARKEALDFKLAAEVASVLAGAGSELDVEADNGNVIVTINKNVLMLSMLKQKIVKLAKDVPGVKNVETKIGKNYYKTDIIHNFDFETPMNVLLVDDEKEFVQTLSERLKMRQVASDVVFNGKDALEFADRENTEVMVLDLKMPGIDGFEVLKRIKETKPEIEVIILTGHGSEEDKRICMEMGAFAYLQKPADIDILTETMKNAYEKVNKAKVAASQTE